MRGGYFARYKGIEVSMGTNSYDDSTSWMLFSSIEVGEKLGFIIDDSMWRKKLNCMISVLPITPFIKLESAYHVVNWCTVDGFKLRIMNYLDGMYYLMVDEKNAAMVKHFGVKPTGYDYLSTSVGKKDEEILDIWEVRTPIKGFPFREPSEVYLKFDGEWLI